jgi:hypothetical protein
VRGTLKISATFWLFGWSMTYLSRQSYNSSVYFSGAFFLSASLTIACLFSDFFNLESRYDFQRFVLVIVISFLPSLILMLELFRNAYLNKYVSIIWLVPALTVLVFSFINIDRYALFSLEGLMFALFLIFVSIVGVWVNKSGCFFGIVLAVIYGLTISSFFYSTSTILEYLFIIADGLDPEKMLPFGFGNVRQWSHIATWLIPLLPVTIMVGPLRSYRIWKAIVIVTATVWWWLIILSAAHGSFAAQALSFAAVLLIFRRKAIRWARIYLTFFFLGFGAWFLLSYLLPNILFDSASEMEASMADGLPARLILWKEAFSMSLANFPFGMGGQSWLTHEPITEPFVNAEVKSFGAPHNMYLLWASEYGWIFILTLFFPAYFIIRGVKRCYEVYCAQSNPLAHVLVGVVASLLAGLLHSGVSSVLLAPAGMIFGLMVFSIAWAFAVSYDDNIPSQKNKSFWVLMTTSTFLLGLFFLSGVVDYKVESDRDRECFEKVGMSGYMPRFWYHGYFPNQINYQCD